jgi:AraC-like DNA-binding protein
MPTSRVNTAVEPDCERVRFATPNLLLGEFRCGSDHARFVEAGRIRNCVIAFPRQAVWIHREDTAPFVADASVATVYSPGVAYERHRLSPAGGDADWFGLSESMAREIVGALAPAMAEGDQPLPFFRAPVPTALYHAQRRLFESLQSSSLSAVAVEEQGIFIARAILSSALAAETRSAVPANSASSAVNVVSRPPSPAARTDLAAALDVSPFHLCRTFRAVTGFTLHGYRRELRLRHALELVPQRRGHLSSLALELGFHSHAHFTAAYRAAFGAAPTAERPRRAMA